MKKKVLEAIGGLPVIIFNRDGEEFRLPEDNWYHIIPKGEFVHKPTGLMQVLDDKACTDIINRFETECETPNFPGVLVDYDHFSQDTDKPSEAAGWITDLDNREDGVWAQIRWSDKGKEAVTGGRYRLVSPVWKRTDCESLDNGRVRPKRLDSVALTNDPNLKGLVPLSNRAGWEIDAEMDYKLELLSTLGLPAEATDEQIKQALDERQHAPKSDKDDKSVKTGKKTAKRVKNRTDTMAEDTKELTEADVQEMLSNREAEFQSEREALTNRITELEEACGKLMEAQVDSDLREYAPVITDAAATKEMLLANRDTTLKFLKGLKEKSDKDKPKTGKDTKPLHNRNDAELPNPIEGAPSDARQAKAVTNRAKQIQIEFKNRGGRELPWAVAFNMAKGELVETE